MLIAHLFARRIRMGVAMLATLVAGSLLGSTLLPLAAGSVIGQKPAAVLLRDVSVSIIAEGNAKNDDSLSDVWVDIPLFLQGLDLGSPFAGQAVNYILGVTAFDATQIGVKASVGGNFSFMFLGCPKGGVPVVEPGKKSICVQAAGSSRPSGRDAVGKPVTLLKKVNANLKPGELAVAFGEFPIKKAAKKKADWAIFHLKSGKKETKAKAVRYLVTLSLGRAPTSGIADLPLAQPQ